EADRCDDSAVRSFPRKQSDQMTVEIEMLSAAQTGRSRELGFEYRDTKSSWAQWLNCLKERDGATSHDVLR
ncbi:MAG TPA: hypothetical protein VLJ79_10540, partial [Candidatus Binatia bacterium]|nr:hypothetical protein [Candidatus Binatia bacterium]